MAKLRADINYNQRIQKESNIKENIDLNNEKNNKDEIDNIVILDNDENGVELLNDDDNQDEEEAKLTSQFNDHLNEWLELLQNEESSNESIEHPAQNADAKWELEIIFENNLHCPF